jgi:hypothetical protein
LTLPNGLKKAGAFALAFFIFVVLVPTADKSLKKPTASADNETTDALVPT